MPNDIHFHLEDASLGAVNITVNETSLKKYILYYPCSSNIVCTPYIAFLRRGFYKFELYGAAGGFASPHEYEGGGIGFGGYSEGYFYSNKTTKMYFYIGGHGTDGIESNNKNTIVPGGYNGGGNGGYDAMLYNCNGGGGGGGTDIRMNDNNIESRIIVAGGGGGGCIATSNGGNGGGQAGQDGLYISWRFGYFGGGGKQDQGGRADPIRLATDGQKYFGGNASTHYQAWGAGGGGGGYYGGAGGTSTKDHWNGGCGSGGGGSGFVNNSILSLPDDDFIAKTDYASNSGNGVIIITAFNEYIQTCRNIQINNHINMLYIFVFLIDSS